MNDENVIRWGWIILGLIGCLIFIGSLIQTFEQQNIKENCVYKIYNTNITCKTGVLYRCGYFLGDCNNGQQINCVGNVVKECVKKT